MKKLVLGILMIGLFTFSSFAQGGKGQKRMEAQKVAFITNYLELTPEESADFWPVRKQFEKDKRAINRKYRPNKKIADMTDEELEAQMLSIFERDQEQIDLKKEYFEKLKKVLSIRKIAMLREAEKEFKTTILDTMKKRRKERRERRMNQNK